MTESKIKKKTFKNENNNYIRNKTLIPAPIQINDIKDDKTSLPLSSEGNGWADFIKLEEEEDKQCNQL